ESFYRRLTRTARARSGNDFVSNADVQGTGPCHRHGICAQRCISAASRQGSCSRIGHPRC
ncbi:hypothetical protein BD626DRAFT_631176, partial [Schizophyllum amplum]